MEEDARAVLDFWFGTLDEHGLADAEHAARWWAKDEAFDAQLRARFGAVHEAVGGGERETWLATPRGRLAYVIVLDQFSRNLFRDSARAFAWDPQARRAAVSGIDRGEDRALGCDERSFLYMPLEHSEQLGDQERCVALFAALLDEAPPEARERVANALDYARQHRDIVRRFGRFPHRNALLGRTSTPEEVEFLKQPGSSF